MKTAKTYRLSARALENLEWLKQVSDANETALVEMAIAVLVGVLPGNVQPDQSRGETPFQPAKPQAQSASRSRKRHRRK